MAMRPRRPVTLRLAGGNPRTSNPCLLIRQARRRPLTVISMFGHGQPSSTGSELSATGQPLFLNLPTVDDLKSGHALRAKVGPRILALKPRVQKPAEMSSIEQAGSSGVLVDQRGRAVYYSTQWFRSILHLRRNTLGRTTIRAPRPRSPIPSLQRSSRHRGASCNLAKISATRSPPPPLPWSIAMAKSDQIEWPDPSPASRLPSSVCMWLG